MNILTRTTSDTGVTWTAINAPRENFARQTWSPRLVQAALCLVACAMGLSIALEKWLILVAAIGLLLLIAWPIEVTLGLYSFLLPFESITATGSGAGPSTTLLWYIGTLAIVVVLAVSWARKRMMTPPRAAWFWTALIVWGAISSTWAIDRDLSYLRLPTAIGLLLLYLAVVSVQITDKEFSRVSLLTILGGCGASLYAVYSFFSAGGGGRGTLGTGNDEADPNFFAMSLLLPLSMTFGEALASRTLSGRVRSLIGGGLIALALFLTMSRGALIAAMVITLVFVVRLRLNWRLMLPLLALSGALMFMPRMFYERVEGASESRAGGRLDIWKAGVRSLESYGLIGAGLENFPNAYDRYAGTAKFYGGSHRSAHNIYLATAVELGFIGIFLLAAAVKSQLRWIRRVSSTIFTSARFVAFEATCWGMLVGGLSLDMLWRKTFWLAWALPILAIHANRGSSRNR